MKFVDDLDPRLVRIQPETAEEAAWLATRPVPGGVKCRRGYEKFVLEEFEWEREHGNASFFPMEFYPDIDPDLWKGGPAHIPLDELERITAAFAAAGRRA